MATIHEKDISTWKICKDERINHFRLHSVTLAKYCLEFRKNDEKTPQYTLHMSVAKIELWIRANAQLAHTIKI